MERIKIDGTPTRVSISHQSKGNQWKWAQNGKWYKVDCFGYEGLAEVVVSEFLKSSNLSKDGYVVYKPCIIEYKGREHFGCVSDDFLQDGEELITLEKYYKSYTSFSLAKVLGNISEVKERELHTVEFFERVAGIEDFGVELTKIIEVDTFFLNEDRHTNNIAILCGKRNRLAPIFDCGAALFSDVRYTFLEKYGYEECLERFKAKPFTEDRDLQLDVAESLYGDHLRFGIKKNDIMEYIEEIVMRYNFRESYGENVIKRIEETVIMQARKYSWMFE